MPIKVFDIKLPVDIQNTTPMIEVRQGDVGGNKIRASLIFKGKPFNIFGATHAAYTVLKSDRTVVSGAEAVIEDYNKGIVSFILTDQAIIYPGTVYCQVEVYTGAVRITTATFCYTVIEDLNNIGDPSSQSEYPILMQLLSDVEELESNVSNAEQGRVLAEQARVTAEQDRITEENIRISNETARINAENIRQSYFEEYLVLESYDNSKNYKPGNKVTYEGSTYQNIKQCTGISPEGNKVYWVQISQKGDKGENGRDGFVTTVDNQYGLYINETGHLILKYGITAPNFSINEDGYLILTY